MRRSRASRSAGLVLGVLAAFASVAAVAEAPARTPVPPPPSPAPSLHRPPPLADGWAVTGAFGPDCASETRGVHKVEVSYAGEADSVFPGEDAWLAEASACAAPSSAATVPTAVPAQENRPRRASGCAFTKDFADEMWRPSPFDAARLQRLEAAAAEARGSRPAPPSDGAGVVLRAFADWSETQTVLTDTVSTLRRDAAGVWRFEVDRFEKGRSLPPGAEDDRRSFRGGVLAADASERLDAVLGDACLALEPAATGPELRVRRGPPPTPCYRGGGGVLQIFRGGRVSSFDRFCLRGLAGEALSIALAPPAGREPDDAAPSGRAALEEITPGRTVDGALTDDDTRTPEGAAYDCFAYDGRRGDDLEVEMLAAGFRPRVALHVGEECEGEPAAPRASASALFSRSGIRSARRRPTPATGGPTAS